MQPVELRMYDVLVAARQAMDEGRLGKYSNSNLIGGKYRYDDGSCCAIGAALSDEDAKRFDSNTGYTGIEKLVNAGLVSLSDPTELEDMAQIQREHDRIPRGARSDAFLKVFEDMEAKYGTR